MKVLLEIEEIRTYQIVVSADSVKEAEQSFDPCHDLDGELPNGGYAKVIQGKEIFDCPRCQGKGRIKGKEIALNIFCGEKCPDCKGLKYFIPDPKLGSESK